MRYAPRQFLLWGGISSLATAVAALFANSEEGIWLDVSDMSSMFQDAAGTMPVTAVEQPVGLRLDKRLGLARGPEKSVNSGFDTDIAGWYVGVNNTAVWSSGEAQVTFAGALTSTAGNWFAVPGSTYVGRRFEISFDATWVSGGNLQVGVAFSVGLTVTAASNAGVKTRYSCMVSAANANAIANATFGATVSAVWKLDNISVKEILGNHAFQPVSSSRATLKQDDLGKNYLKYDGLDDFYQTASLNFTGTDKMTVVVGVRKLSDSATSLVCEFGASSSVDGSFYIAAPGGTGLPNVAFATRGTVAGVGLSPSGYAAPVSKVLVGQFDHAGSGSGPLAQIRVRVDGVLIASASGTTAGNYANAPFYIGSRAGVSLRFSGQEYGIILRAAQSLPSQVEDLERFINSKM